MFNSSDEDEGRKDVSNVMDKSNMGEYGTNKSIDLTFMNQ